MVHRFRFRTVLLIKNYWLRRDLNSVSRTLSQARWPLDNNNDDTHPCLIWINIFSFLSYKSVNIGLTECLITNVVQKYFWTQHFVFFVNCCQIFVKKRKNSHNNFSVSLKRTNKRLMPSFWRKNILKSVYRERCQSARSTEDLSSFGPVNAEQLKNTRKARMSSSFNSVTRCQSKKKPKWF